MKVSFSSQHKLVLEHTRWLRWMVLAVFTMLSGLTLFNILLQGLRSLDTLRGWQWMGWLTWLTFALVMTVIGAMTWFNTGRKFTCTFDRDAETVTITQASIAGKPPQQMSIYSVSHVDVQRNEAVRVIGLFLVLRSNEKIPLTTMPFHDEAQAHDLTRTIRQFLRQV